MVGERPVFAGCNAGDKGRVDLSLTRDPHTSRRIELSRGA